MNFDPKWAKPLRAALLEFIDDPERLYYTLIFMAGQEFAGLRNNTRLDPQQLITDANALFNLGNESVPCTCPTCVEERAGAKADAASFLKRVAAQNSSKKG